MNMEATTNFFESILGIKPPWHVTKVTHDNDGGRVDLYVEHEKGIRFVGGRFNGYHNLLWRTCQFWGSAPAPEVLRHKDDL